MSEHVQTLRIRRQRDVYTCGDHDRMIYWIQSGHVKLRVPSSDGKECLLDIYRAGEFFGESCLAGFEHRVETATAMGSTVLKRIACDRFAAALSGAELRSLLGQLSRRIVELQLLVTDMATTGSEFRLGKTLLRLASHLGKRNLAGTVIDCRISQEELSRLVGTTRPRISEFMQKFRDLGLIAASAERLIIIKEERLTRYLAAKQ